jgi:hypothetical protein
MPATGLTSEAAASSSESSRLASRLTDREQPSDELYQDHDAGDSDRGIGGAAHQRASPHLCLGRRHEKNRSPRHSSPSQSREQRFGVVRETFVMGNGPPQRLLLSGWDDELIGHHP